MEPVKAPTFVRKQWSAGFSDSGYERSEETPYIDPLKRAGDSPTADDQIAWVSTDFNSASVAPSPEFKEVLDHCRGFNVKELDDAAVSSPIREGWAKTVA